MDAKFTRRRFLAAASAGTAYLALTNTVGCELLGRASKVGRSRTPKVRALQTPLVSPLPNISSPFPDGLWTFARRLPDDTISIFDNGTTVFRGGLPDAIEESRAIVLELDEWRMRASLVGEYTHPQEQLPDAAGNTQVLANGNVFVGWGRALAISEFSHDGELLFDAGLPPENRSYRAFRFPWNGHPTDRPACVAERTSEEEVKALRRLERRHRGREVGGIRRPEGRPTAVIGIGPPERL